MPRIAPLDLEAAAPDARAAADAHVRNHARMTNMKRTLFQSLPAFQALMEWYPAARCGAAVSGRTAHHPVRPRHFRGDRLPDLLDLLPPDAHPTGENPERLKLDDREDAVLDFGRALAVSPFKVSEEV